MIGWKDSREAMRALHDALPYLHGAKQVHLATPIAARRPGTPGGDVDRYLAAHGIKNRTIHTVLGDGDAAAESLLSLVADVEADLLVTGAYGHSRVHEVLMGGTTRTLLRNPP